MEDNKLYGYRWVMLVLAFLVHCGLQIAILITMGMGALMMGPAVGLTITEFSMIATMPYLTGFLFGLVGGAWADRKSIRTVMIFGLAIASVGAIILVGGSECELREAISPMVPGKVDIYRNGHLYPRCNSWWWCHRHEGGTVAGGSAGWLHPRCRLHCSQLSSLDLPWSHLSRW